MIIFLFFQTDHLYILALSTYIVSYSNYYISNVYKRKFLLLILISRSLFLSNVVKAFHVHKLMWNTFLTLAILRYVDGFQTNLKFIFLYYFYPKQIIIFAYVNFKPKVFDFSLCICNYHFQMWLFTKNFAQ